MKQHLPELCWMRTFKLPIQMIQDPSIRNSADAGFRSDQMCVLVVFWQLFMHMPPNRKSLLWYKRKEISHSLWLTTANGYLRMLLFDSSDLTTVEKIKLLRLVSYIVSVYLPSFLKTHIKPHACEGPFVTLFQRDLLLAFEAVDSDDCKEVNRYFLQHAKSWLSPRNIAFKCPL